MIGQNERQQTLPANNGFRFRLGWRAPASAVLFLIIPICFVISVSQLTHAKGPQWLPYTFENSYNYLLNSLLLVEGRAPPYIMHPGTTTQAFGALILRGSSLASTDELVRSTLRSPEKQIKKLHEALLVFTALILWIFPWFTAVLLRDYAVGLLIQAPTLFYRTLLYWGILFGPELMNVGFSVAAICCCVLLLVPSAVSERELLLGIVLGFVKPPAIPGSPRLLRIPLLPALAGMVCAFGTVTKLIFFPLILIALLCCRTRRNVASFMVAFVLGLALALLPIYPQIPRLMTWIFDLSFHSGHYGAGPLGFPDISAYLTSLSGLFETEPLFIIISSVTVVVVIGLSLLPTEQKDVLTVSGRTALLVFGLQAVSYLIIAKDGSPRYLIPLVLTSGLSLVLLFYVFQSSHRTIKQAIGWVTLIGLLFLGCKDFVEYMPRTYENLRAETADQLRLYREAKEITKHDVRVDYFFSDSPELPLCNGNNTTEGAFGPVLASLYPNELFFNVFNGKFQTFTEFIEPEVVMQKYDHLYFFGNLSFFPKVDGFDPTTFKTIDHAGAYYLQKWIRK
ncbi:MAG: hypothetical protein WAK31_08325 [Chthoniobacterales bacterium]